MGDDRATMDDLRVRIDDLTRLVASMQADLDALRARADRSDVRADVANARSDAAEARADAADVRADEMEARAQIDRDMIVELQAESLLSREHADQMEQALKSSRTIGAALGLIMAGRDVREDEAFTILRAASQRSNRKLRDMASELVATGGLSDPLA